MKPIEEARHSNTTRHPNTRLLLYPDAGEATITRTRRATLRSAVSVRDDERSLRESARRAQRRIRRYTVANRLSRLVTFTFEGSRSPSLATVRDAMQEALRRLRRTCSRRFPYVWVPERGPKGGRLHVHALFAVDVSIKEVWRFGRVEVEPLGGIDAMRGAAHYVAKDFESSHVDRAQRYSIAQNFQPQREEIFVDSPERGIDEAIVRMGPPADLLRGDWGVSLRWN